MLHTSWDIHVLAINYNGDPHPINAKLYFTQAKQAHDYYGMARINELIVRLNKGSFHLEGEKLFVCNL
jgi:hypothetical protein